ncbi:hypothetical protein JN01_0716 [Entomoplasma freundtii]|uniref:Uncharacterized protein n=1 Tax=Entomoplasma freundtii TaxID=74700 RepID=A0A2K8NRM2_9MOLU|nr:lipoprotein [Entomoplasma freundtii]ATZ16495.1 hypothetical protein EFREU_v1c04690 [Entomoplasma freundtii]TDY56024.1 hypothetical protein JN01_0716 [Entomoplasma freundtii]
MKKILTVLGSLVLTTTSATLVVSCGSKNTEFNQLMKVVNNTKGTYDNNNFPNQKSSASVIYLGAKDNAASQSFEAALKQAFSADSLDQAEKKLSQPGSVTQTSTYERSIRLDQPSATNSLVTFIPDTVDNDLQTSTFVKVQFVDQPGLSELFFDATFQGLAEGTYVFSQTDSDFLNNHFSGDFPANLKVKLQGFTTSLLTNDGLVSSWQNALVNGWFNESNADRGIRQVTVDTSGKNAGRITEIKAELPFYGIKGTDSGILSNAYTYAKPQLTFKAFTVDKVSDYWNNEVFKQLLNDYIRPDLIQQAAANSNSSESFPEPDKTRGDKEIFKQRVKNADAILGKIKEQKGPTFLIIKNGHLIAMQNGWNTYKTFNGEIQGSPTIENNGMPDLMSWVGSLAKIFSESTNSRFQDNNQFITTSFATTNWDPEKDGKSNWDPEKGLPK